MKIGASLPVPNFLTVIFSIILAAIFLCSGYLEVNLIYEYRQKIADFKDDLLADNTFITFVKQHRFYRNTEKYLDEIYSISA